MNQSFHSFDSFGDEPGTPSAIAIVGMSCRFANLRTLDDYWALLRDGKDAVETYTEEQLLAAGVSPALLRNPNYLRTGIPLADMEYFDAGLFGLSKRDAAVMDPQHRHFLECSWEALENAGHTPQGFDGVIGVFAGSGHNAYMPYNLLTNTRLVQDVGLFMLRHTSNDKDFLSTRVSYLLDLKGPSINVQTACSTSLVAIHMAAQSLLNGECDMALAGAASIELPHRHGYLFEEGEILSPDGHCRPFDVNSKGTVFGSGAAVLVLRRLEDAISSGDHIHAVIRGSAINNDGASKVGYFAPSVDGQAKVIAEALAIAGVAPDSIDYVEAHGTGTPIGDPIEIAALTQAFELPAKGAAKCAIGSVKANIGHTDTAAGAAGVIKVALAMTHGELPPVPNFEAPNPGCGFERSPFQVQAKRAPWPGVAGQPRRAGVSSLGVGGTNAHVVLEQAPPRAESDGSRRRRHLLLVSGRSDSAADANALRLAEHFSARPETSLADAAFTLTSGRQHLERRRFAIGGNAADAAASLGLANERAIAKQPCVPGRPVAFMFCGAGPHHVGMARGLYESEPVFRAEVDQALACLSRIGAPDVGRWLFPVEADREQAPQELIRPSIGLPALFIIQTALAKLWRSLGIEPSAMIGHSSGEYAAAHIAGVIDLEDGLKIVHARGRLFEATEKGGMISVTLPEEELAALLPPGISIAAINAPRLCIVSGGVDAIANFHDVLTEREIEAQRVPISVAAHSAMLDPILAEFRELLKTVRFSKPQIRFASNLTGDWVRDQEATDPEYWVRHLRQPVRFTDGLQCLLSDPELVLLEVGPGRSMTSLGRQHPARKPSQPTINSLRHPEEQVEDEVRFLEAVGELWTVGVHPDWAAWWGEERRLRIPLPTYQFDRERHWIEPGAGLSLGGGGGDDTIRRGLANWSYEGVWQREDLPAAEGVGGPALVLLDEAGFGERLAGRLRESGTDVITARAGRRLSRLQDAFTLRPAERGDWAGLFDCLAQEQRLPQQVYHCWLVGGGAEGRRDHRRMMELGLYSLAAMAPELASACYGTDVRVGLVTDGAQRVGGDAIVFPAKAAALGSARVISAEYGNLQIRNVDLAPVASLPPRLCADLAKAVIAEVAAAAEPRNIAYRAGERWVLEYRPIADAADPAAAADAAPGSSGTYLITGGLGGLGLTIARHLAETRKARLVLVSRKQMPAREEWAALIAKGGLPLQLEEKIRKLMALEAAGAQFEIAVADVADVRALGGAVRKAVARFGPITGIFHAAGVLDDGLVEGRTRESIAAVLRPKIEGTLALEEVFRRDPPEFMMLFSSISAIAGIPGQIDYAAANAFLDSYAEARRGDPVTRVMAVGWSQWAEVGMAAHLGRRNGRATDLPEELGEGLPMAHPFLERVHRISDEELVFTARLSPQRHWVLDEHRIAGAGAVLPGTSYLELARAVMALADPGPLEISDLTFLKPFAVLDGEERELRVHLRQRADNGWRFSVLGRSEKSFGAGWIEHASGLLHSRDIPPMQANFDIEAIAARCLPGRGGGEDQPMLQFGPRWNNLKRTLLGADEALLELTLPKAFHEDLESVLLHPALLDFATAGAQALIHGRNSSREFFAPFTYRRFVLLAPLPAQIFSYIRHHPNADAGGQTAVFDVTIIDLDGQVLAEISDFTMMRVADAALLTRSSAPAERVEPDGGVAMSDRQLQGILPEEGMHIISRLLDSSSRSRVVISPYELGGLLSQLRGPPVTRHGATSADPADRPATEAEQVIADLWCDLLGLEAIGRNDNFFDLGGHSLLAVQFTNRLRKKTGRTLPLAAMLGQPTVASLAAILDPDSRALPGRPDSAAAAPATAGDVVTIREGKAAAPLFFVHDGLGETLLYRGLALRLDPAHPVLGLEPLRTADGNYAHTRIDQMAANYIERMRTVQPEGPYLLAGLCAGGVIAFEMARQLQDVGQEVAFLGIIDAADVQAAKQPFLVWRLRMARVRSLLGGASMEQALPDLWSKAWNMVRWEIGSRLQRAQDRRTVRQLRAAGPAPAAAAADWEPSIPFLKLYEIAHLEHRPTGVLECGSVVLFKASDHTGMKDDVPYRTTYSDFALGWGKRVRNDLVIYDVPGGHSSVLQPPHVETLAQLFQGALDAALADTLARQVREREFDVLDYAAVAAE